VRIEARPDGALLLTEDRGPRPGLALVGLGAGLAVLAPVVSGEAGVLGAAALVPLALMLALAGLAAARHRDWMLFDPRAREVVFRRGLGSIVRSVSVFGFAEVTAIVIEPDRSPAGAFTVSLVRDGDHWPVAGGLAALEAERLATALGAVGTWPVERTPEPRP
jgi:hypothetical protein